MYKTTSEMETVNSDSMHKRSRSNETTPEITRLPSVIRILATSTILYKTATEVKTLLFRTALVYAVNITFYQ